ASADQRELYSLDEFGGTLSWNAIDLHVSVAGLMVGREGQNAVRPMRAPRSVEACRSALTACSRGEARFEWAKAQCDLGTALLPYYSGASAPCEDDARRRLMEAIGAYRAALEEYSREDTPHQWIMAQGYLAAALFALGFHEP